MIPVGYDEKGADRGHEAATRVLEAIVSGEAPSREDMLYLADAVLEQPVVRAALEVRGAGANALQRAGELAVAALADARVVEMEEIG